MTNKTPLYLKIAESIRQLIASGEYAAGDKLPSMRDMAQRWDCTAGTVRRAYAQLTREGLVSAHRGGGTRVTPSNLHPGSPTWGWAALINQAEAFLLEALKAGHDPHEAQTALSVAIARWQELQAQDLPQPRTSMASADIRFAGSHDLVVSFLERMLAERNPPIRFQEDYVGSLGGLMALTRADANVAGIHLWDEQTDTYNIPFVRRVLPGKKLALVSLVKRWLGLILPTGNSQGIEGLTDLNAPEIVLVNRQPGSGTRVWLDAKLRENGIEPEAISGYDHEESTHLAVAQAVADGDATVGIGIQAAAAAYGLDFVPLTQESYDLVVLEECWQTPAIQALLEIIASATFTQAVETLKGYDLTTTGEITWIS
ncbi:MAG: GntR family transcriptional regulator [Anaerolineales bacterium]|nr:GntR family transcriptional regulator [Anaerolineales bacterium]